VPKPAVRRRRIITAVVTLVTLGAVGLTTVNVVLPFLRDLRPSKSNEVEDFPGPGSGPVEIVVKSGEMGAEIAHTLTDAGVVATEKSFISAYSANPASQSITPGTYALLKEMKASDAVVALLNPTNRVVIKVMIPEGFRARQIYTRVSDELGIPVEDLVTAAGDPVGIGLPEEAKGDVEGWLFPATYDFDPNTTATQVLARMVARTLQELDLHEVPQKKWRKIIILASVVEKESKLPDDRPKVARVFLNRNKIQMPWQSDATVAYGVQEFDSVFTSDEARADDNAYNTYLHASYPGGAICNPGADAIAAAVNPTPKKHWLYFIAVNLVTGETLYSDDLNGHAANRDVLQEWLDEHPGEW